MRRERPHPGAQLDAFEHRDGHLYQTFATNTHPPVGRSRSSKPVTAPTPRFEDRTAVPKTAACARLPSRELAIDTAWLELVLVAADLTAWLQTAILADQPESGGPGLSR